MNHKYIDTHSHLQDKAFDSDREDIIRRMIAGNIYSIIIGVDYDDSRKAMELSMKYKNIYYTIGVHPCDDVFADFNKTKFRELINEKCVAIGECGLDYFYLNKNYEKLVNEVTCDTIEITSETAIDYYKYVTTEKNRQKDLFIKQIEFAIENDLPLMLHGRPSDKNDADNPDGMDAYHDMITILSATWGGAGGGGLNHSITPSALRTTSQREALNERRGNVHFFVGNIDIANKFMDLGFNFSFGGVVTLSHDYDEVLRHVPINKINAETDSPYVTPKDRNGKRVGGRNSPLNLPMIIEKIADIKGLNSVDIQEILISNARELYRINL